MTTKSLCNIEAPGLVIFDMDGTLVQSEDCASQAIKDVVPNLQDPLNEVTRRYRGMRLADIFSDIERRFPHSVPTDWLEMYRVREEELSVSMITATDNAALLLDKLEAPCCIASNAPIEKTQRSLSTCGLLERFSGSVYSAYEVNAWKPDPTLFLHAANDQGMPPERCLVVEDSEVGVEAALAAQMQVIYFDPHKAGCRYSVTCIESLLDVLTYI